MPSAQVDVATRNNVTITGAGRPLVFVHGYGCSQEVWRKVVPAFADDHQVFLIDNVGAGNSDRAAYRPGKYDSLEGYAADLEEVLEHYDLRDAVIVGHSVGAIIGMLAANRAPSRVGALVLVGPSPRYIDSDDYRGGFSRDDIDGLLENLDNNYFAWSHSMAPVITGAPEQPALAEELTESFCRTDPTIARHFAHVTFLSDNRRDLAEVAQPTLVIQSSDDVIAPTAVGEYVADRIPHSTLVVLPMNGHCAHLSEPDLVASAIREFLS